MWGVSPHLKVLQQHPRQVWEPLTSREITLPGSWIPMLWQRPSSLHIQHDVTKIVSWLATARSPAILFSEILFSVWGATFLPDDQNWDHSLPSEPPPPTGMQRCSSHRTVQNMLWQGQRPHRRFTTHTHREWTELLFYYRLKWGLVSSTKLETCYQCHSLFRSQGYNDTTVPSTTRERKTLQHAMQTRRNVILGHQEGKSGNKGVINTWARSTAMSFQVSWAWILQAFPQTSCGPSPEWNPSEPVSCTPAM